MQLNGQQKSIVGTLGGRVAVVAGAGSGKTTTTIELIKKLHVEDGIPLAKMFISTFTNKAGRDLKSKLSNKLGVDRDDLERLWIGTFHSLGFRYLTQIKKMKLNIILPVEASHYLKNIYRQVIKDEGEEENLVVFKDIIDSIEKKRNIQCTWEQASPFPEICEKVHNIYQKEKIEQDLVDFNDILDMFAVHLKIDPMFTSKFSWIFVDESQDNNAKQIEVANLLANKNAVFVGDSKQSIYGFRGAAPHLFKEMAKTASIVYPLAYNYRSTPQIIDFANVLLKQMPQFEGQELIATASNGVKPVYTICDNAAFRTFRAIKDDIRNGTPLDEIAVLARSVKPVSLQSLQVLLRRDNIPYTVRGGSDKLNAPFIQNYLSVLKSIVKPTKVSLVNAMGILPAVGPKTAMKLAETVVQNGNDFGILQGAQAHYAQTKAFKDYLHLDSVKGDSKELLLRGLDFLHDHHLVTRYGKKDPAEPSNKKNIIFDVLYEYLLGFKTVSEGIDSLYINEDDIDADKGKIVISTIHQSKGLEWDSVHIMNMNEFGIPFLKGEDEGDDTRLEEEFCLAYVAITRARKKLRMYMQFMNGQHDWAKPNKISRFIKEVYKTHQERYFSLRVLDVEDEDNYKQMIYLKANGG